jgi:hypothetical protein
MEAGIDFGFTALMVAAVSGSQHRDRASRPQKELYCDIAGLFLKTRTCYLSALGPGTPNVILIAATLVFF